MLRTSARDEVTEMFCKRMAVIHKKGRARLEALREEHREASERLMEVFGDVLPAVREAAGPGGAASDGAADDESGAHEDDPGDGPAEAAVRQTALTGELVLKALAAGGGVAAGWRLCRRRTRRWPPTTATTTCRCASSTTSRPG
ncbi:hypothetical protein AB0I81_29570 [Nonomuraea sp. NPDC050404]|uniref:hypothetical protein n=1 Tax=Nonomuraea sp. NPDC050404 TaxID=3155783 RepID=UPI0033D5A3C8